MCFHLIELRKLFVSNIMLVNAQLAAVQDEEDEHKMDYSFNGFSSFYVRIRVQIC